MEERESCRGCVNDLGGGRDNCLLNVAYECRDGGGFEAYKAKEGTDKNENGNSRIGMVWDTGSDV